MTRRVPTKPRLSWA